MLMVAAVIAWTKTLAYVSLVAVFSVSAGLLYGAWVDGLGWLPSFLALSVFVALLAGTMVWLGRRQMARAAA
jgi:ABC-type xylose transport system permease subunit